MELTTFKSIHKIALPAIVAGIAEPILSSTDAAIVGNISYNSKEALAAVGIVGSFLSMLIWVLGQSRSVISSIISQYFGANKLKEIATLPGQAILLNLILSIVLAILTFLFANTIFVWYKASGLVLEYSLSYFKIRVWGFPFTLFVFAVFGIFRGLQNTYWPMVVAIVGALLNIILDIILVYGVSDIVPAMHVEGAAWASLISQMVMAIIALMLLLSKTNISLRLGDKIHPEVYRLLGMNGNLILRAVSLNIALFMAVRTATGLGDHFVAAHVIALNLWLFTAFFIDGYAAAGNIYGGRLKGANDYSQLTQLVKKVVLYGILVALLLMLIGAVFYKELGMLFSNDTEVLSAFYGVFFLVILLQPANAVAFVLDGVFKGLGEMKYLRNLLFFATFLGFLPTLIISQYLEYKLLGVWLAMAAWLIFRSVGMFLQFQKKYALQV